MPGNCLGYTFPRETLSTTSLLSCPVSYAIVSFDFVSQSTINHKMSKGLVSFLSQSNHSYNIANFNQIQWFKVLITLQHISTAIKDFPPSGTSGLILWRLVKGCNELHCMLSGQDFFLLLKSKGCKSFFSVWAFLCLFFTMFVYGNASKSSLFTHIFQFVNGVFSLWSQLPQVTRDIPLRSWMFHMSESQMGCR